MFLCFVCLRPEPCMPMLPLSLDCPFFIDSLVFSNFYLLYTHLIRCDLDGTDLLETQIKKKKISLFGKCQYLYLKLVLFDLTSNMVVYISEVMYCVLAYLSNITFNLQDEDILVVTQRFNKKVD